MSKDSSSTDSSSCQSWVSWFSEAGAFVYRAHHGPNRGPGLGSIETSVAACGRLWPLTYAEAASLRAEKEQLEAMAGGQRCSPLKHFSMDWFKGKSTGNPGVSHDIWGFPVNFPLNQSIEFRPGRPGSQKYPKIINIPFHQIHPNPPIPTSFSTSGKADDDGSANVTLPCLYMGVSENSVPLNPMVHDHYPY